MREIASIVLGVLIALALGAIATDIGWRIEVRSARTAMKGELGELIGQAEERIRTHDCVERRLDRLAAIVGRAEADGRLPPLGAIGAPPYRTWPAGVWQSTIAAQTAAHLDREALDNYSTAYDFASQMAADARREADVWTRLYALAGPGRRFEGVEAGTLRDAIGQARLLNRLIALKGARMKQVVIAYDLGYDADEAALYGRAARSTFEICRPIGAIPPSDYGQAPLAGALQRAVERPITRGGGAR